MKLVTGIAAIGEDVAQPGPSGAARVEQIGWSIAIPDVGRVDAGPDDQDGSVGHDRALAALSAPPVFASIAPEGPIAAYSGPARTGMVTPGDHGHPWLRRASQTEPQTLDAAQFFSGQAQDMVRKE